MAQYLLLFSKS